MGRLDTPRGQVASSVVAPEGCPARAPVQPNHLYGQYFIEICESVDDLFWLRDPDGNRVLWANSAYERVWGRSLADLYKDPHDWVQACVPEDRPRVLAAMAAGISRFHETYRIRRPDGSQRWIEDRAFPIVGDTGRVHRVAGIAQDITQRVLAQEGVRRRDAELARMGRVAMTTEIAAGISHELNQPLAAIVNYCEGCLDRLQREGLNRREMAESLTRARDLALHAAEVIRRLRRLVKKTAPHNSSVAIDALVYEAVELLRYELESRGVVLVLELDDVPLILGDSVRLQQVVLNLLLNSLAAVDAVAAHCRKITVTARNTGASVQVSVKDRGVGFPPDTAETLFQPFYTTKPDGLGMGLPLSRVIVEDHGGKLWAERTAGETAFHFTVPLFDSVRKARHVSRPIESA